MNRLMMKKLAIMKSLNGSGYLRTAAGYPVTLTKPKSLQAITVCGNDGGVGDRTENLFTTANILRGLTRNDKDTITVNGVNGISIRKTNSQVQERMFIIIPNPKADTDIAISCTADSSITIVGMACFDTIYTTVAQVEAVFGSNNIAAFKKTINTGQSPYIGIRLTTTTTALTGTFNITNIMLNEGTNALPYEPYGYEIPVLFGDRTINLYSPQQLQQRDSVNLFDKDNIVWIDGYYIREDGKSVKPGAGKAQYSELIYLNAGVYTISNLLSDNETRTGNLRIHEYDVNGRWLRQLGYIKTDEGSASAPCTFTTTTGIVRISLVYNNSIPAFDTTMLNEGSDALPYEPYGQKMPDVLTMSIPDKTIMLNGNTDISNIQDWTQDFALPKADELTVTADTTVEPSSIKVEYYSKTRR